MTGPRGGRYIVHNGNKHYLRAGESPSQAAVRVGAGVAPSAKGRVLAQKARGKFNAGQERQMKKVEASYAKDVARNAAKKAGGGKVVNVGSGSAAAQAAAKAAAAEVKAEKKAAKPGSLGSLAAKADAISAHAAKTDTMRQHYGALKAHNEAAAAHAAAGDHEKAAYHRQKASGHGQVVADFGGGKDNKHYQENMRQVREANAKREAEAKNAKVETAVAKALGMKALSSEHKKIVQEDVARKGGKAVVASAKQAKADADRQKLPEKKERPKFDAMADAEAHIAKLKAESAAKNAAKAPAAVGGYGGPPPSGEQTNKKLPNPDRLPLGKVDGSNRARDLAAATAPQLRDGYGGDKAAQDRPRAAVSDTKSGALTGKAMDATAKAKAEKMAAAPSAQSKADEIVARMRTGKGTPTGEAMHAGARAKFGNPNSHQRAFEAHSLAAEYHEHMGDKKMQAEHQKEAGYHEAAIGAMMDKGQYVTKQGFYPAKKGK